MSCTEHSSHSAAPPINTAPPREAFQFTAVKRLAASFDDRALQDKSWSLARTLTPNRGIILSAGHVVEVCATHTDASGGSRETDVNELAAIPCGLPLRSPAIAITPLGNELNARRSLSGGYRRELLPPASTGRESPKCASRASESPGFTAVIVLRQFVGYRCCGVAAERCVRRRVRRDRAGAARRPVVPRTPGR